MEFEQLNKAYEAVELLKTLDLPVSDEQLTAISDLEKKYLRESVIPSIKHNLEPFFSSFVNIIKMTVDFSPEEGLRTSIIGENRPSYMGSEDDTYVEGRERKKYAIDGGTPLNKRRFVLEVVRKYVETHPDISLDELERVFPSRLSNSPLNGVVRTYESVVNRIKTQPDLKKRFLLEPEELITLSDGTKVTIYNQWGRAFGQFLQLAKQLHKVESYE